MSELHERLVLLAMVLVAPVVIPLAIVFMVPAILAEGIGRLTYAVWDRLTR